MKKVTLLLIPIANPLLIGIYQNNQLIKVIKKKGKTSDILPEAFKEILETYEVEELLYVNGPGSYMSIKVSYLFLRTLSIVKNIELYSCDGFTFNQNSPIKALGKKYFFKDNDGKITIEFLKDDTKLQDFSLPQKLHKDLFNKDCLPSYNMPAVN